MYLLGCIQHILEIITGFAGQHTDLVDIRLDHRRLCLDTKLQHFAAGIQDHLFTGILADLYEFLVCCAIQSFRHAAGHGNHISFFYETDEFLHKSVKISFGNRKSRFQILRLYMVYAVPDIDAGTAFFFHMVKGRFDAKRF